jgi:uncharacterized protein with PIN domain
VLEHLLIIEPKLNRLKGHPMNDTIMHYVMYFTTFIYLSYVTIYIIKNIPKQKDPLQGLVFILDVLRYTSMFLSFMLTMYFGTEWGNQLIGSKSLDPLETILAYGFTILLSASAGALISSLLLYCERAITSVVMSRVQIYTVISIYMIVATLDFLTLSLGGGSIAKSFEMEDIAKIEIKQDTSSLFVIDAKKEIALDLQEQLKAVKVAINTIGNTQLKITKRVRTLQATLVRCAKKNDRCPQTNTELARITKTQQSKKLEGLNKRRASILSKLFEITNSYELTSTRLKTAKSDAIKNIEDKSKSLQWWITFGSIVFVMVNLFLAFVRGILANSLEVEEIDETEDEIEDAREKYIYAAMAQYVDEHETHMPKEMVDMDNLIMNFPRDTILPMAKQIANDNRTILKIGGNRASEIIKRLSGAGGGIRVYASEQSWNKNAITGYGA